MKGSIDGERHTQLKAEFQKIPRRDKKALLNEQCKEIEKNNRMRKTSYLVKKIGNIKVIFHARMDTIKNRHSKDITETEKIEKRGQEHRRTIQKKS